MRLRTDLVVSAIVRRVFARGDYAAVEKKGAEEAGAIFLRQLFRDGRESLHGPAPQSLFDSEDSGQRLFETRLDRVETERVAEAIARERRFDEDLWVVALEVEDIGDLVEFAGEAPEDDGFFRPRR